MCHLCSSNGFSAYSNSSSSSSSSSGLGAGSDGLRRSDTGRLGSMPSLPGSIAGAPEVVEGGGGVPVCGGDDEPPTPGPLLASGAGTATAGAMHEVNYAGHLEKDQAH